MTSQPPLRHGPRRGARRGWPRRAIFVADGRRARKGKAREGSAGGAGDGRDRRAADRAGPPAGDRQRRGLSRRSSLKARVDGQIVDGEFPRRRGGAARARCCSASIRGRIEAALRQAEANALRDTAARDQARSQEQRYQELLEKNFVSKEAYAQIRTNAETAEATARASQAALENARLNLEYCTIRSPIDGYVGKVLLQPGNLVQGERRQSAGGHQPGAADLRQLRGARAEPARGAQVHGAAGRSRSMSLPPDPQRRRASRARLIFVDNAVDPSTGTIRLRAQFDNADAALWPGQFVNVSLRLYEQDDAIVIPVAARCRPAPRASTCTWSSPT